MDKRVSEMSVAELIGATIGRVRDVGQPTREQALVITKLQEALHWLNDYERELKDAARRSGVGPSVRDPRGQTLGGVMLTEPVDLSALNPKPNE